MKPQGAKKGGEYGVINNSNGPESIFKMVHRREITSIIWFGIIILVLLSLISFSPADLSILKTPANSSPQNLIGIVGAWIGFVFYSLFGAVSYLLVFLAFGLALLHFLSAL